MTRPNSMAEERERIQEEYRRRDADPSVRRRYDPGDPEIRRSRERRRSAMRSALADAGLMPLGERRILEVGCGSGAILEDLVALGARPEHLHGVDISAERLALVPAPLRANVLRADATALPYPDRSFDIVAQFTTFSSMLDATMRQTAAAEMLRVLRPDGAILWYDMRRSSRASRTIALGPSEVRGLFPGTTLRTRSITLAPPLARRIAPRLPALADALERLPLLRTHLLVVARRAA